MARLYPQALGCLFVASYDSQGYGGGIRPSLRMTGVLVIQHFGMDRIENTFPNSFSVIACELVALGTYLFRYRYVVTGLHATIL
jgi:hypothetical protein